MQIAQLVSILGFLLAHAQALPLAQLDSAKSIALLITNPKAALSELPEYKEVAQVAGNPMFHEQMLVRGAYEAIQPDLMSFGTAHTPYILKSLQGLHETRHQAELPAEVGKVRAAIYQSSLYSRLHDLNNLPGGSEHLPLAYERLMLDIESLKLDIKSSQIALMGDQKVLDKLREHFKLTPDQQKQLAEQFKHLEKHLPETWASSELKYLTVDQVNSALQATNKPGIPDAIPVNAVLPISHRPSPAPQAVHKQLPAPTEPTRAPAVATAA